LLEDVEEGAEMGLGLSSDDSKLLEDCWKIASRLKRVMIGLREV
jgi:hypothetical protein